MEDGCGVTVGAGDMVGERVGASDAVGASVHAVGASVMKLFSFVFGLLSSVVSSLILDKGNPIDNANIAVLHILEGEDINPEQRNQQREFEEQFREVKRLFQKHPSRTETCYKLPH